MDYNIHTNKATKPNKNIEFMQTNDYETLETLILNVASNTHILNNNKNLSNDMDLPSRVKL
jgi:hypothetical protein